MVDVDWRLFRHFGCLVNYFCNPQNKTYHALELLAAAQEDFLEAKANLQKALEIYVEFKDEYSAARSHGKY